MLARLGHTRSVPARSVPALLVVFGLLVFAACTGSRGFGLGNFKALFEAIELEQEKRGNL